MWTNESDAIMWDDGIIDHGSLGGLGDAEDHPDYIMLDGSRVWTGSQQVANTPDAIKSGDYALKMKSGVSDSASAVGFLRDTTNDLTAAGSVIDRISTGGNTARSIRRDPVGGLFGSNPSTIFDMNAGSFGGITKWWADGILGSYSFKDNTGGKGIGIFPSASAFASPAAGTALDVAVVQFGYGNGASYWGGFRSDGTYFAFEPQSTVLTLGSNRSAGTSTYKLGGVYLGDGKKILFGNSIDSTIQYDGNIFQFLSGAVDGAAAVGYNFDTTNDLITSGAKLAKFSSAGSEKVSYSLNTKGYARVVLPDTETTPNNFFFGYSTVDTQYAGMFNDFGDFWLGINGDRTTYINFYNGTSIEMGTNTNRQIVNAYVSSFNINHTATRSLGITPNVTNGLPYYFNFGGNSTGMYLADNKFLGFGTGVDATIKYDGTDLVVDSQAVGTGRTDVLHDLVHDGYYGGFYQNEVPTTITVSVANTWYDITGNTVTFVNGMTFATDLLTIAANNGGKYLLTWSVALYDGGGTQNFEIGAAVNGTVDGSTVSHTTTKGANESECCSGSSILDLAAADTVGLKIRNTSSTNNPIINHLTLTLTWVGK